MKRLIYSIYIDIPKDLLDPQPPHHGETEDKNQKAKRHFAEHYNWLLERQKEYADKIGADYKHFTYDDKYIELQKWYNKRHPYITEYNIVNFYKIHLMDEMVKEYDEILYLDLDVLPATDENFFDEHPLSEGIAIKKNAHGKSMDKGHLKKREDLFLRLGHNSSIRSPWAKWWNSKALCMNYGKPINDIPVYNTGIVGINKYWWDKMKYFEEFDELLEEMKEMKEEENSMWPKFVQAMFGWDNETIWGFKCHMNDIPSNWLNAEWHMFLDGKQPVIPNKSKFIHIINKEFANAKEWYEQNRL
jgi:hypothetical protein